MDDANSNTWAVPFNLVLLAGAVLLFGDAGPAGIDGAEVGTGFFPKIAAVALGLLCCLNLWHLSRSGGRLLHWPEGGGMILLCFGAGIAGAILFVQLGILAALLAMIAILVALFEKGFGWRSAVFSLLVGVAMHLFFVGGLGVFDPAGRLIDLQWVTPW